MFLVSHEITQPVSIPCKDKESFFKFFYLVRNKKVLSLSTSSVKNLIFSACSEDDGARSDGIDDENSNTEQESDADSADFSDDNFDQIKAVKQRYDGMRICDHVDSSDMYQYFEISINNKKKFIHKQTAVCTHIN